MERLWLPKMQRLYTLLERLTVNNQTSNQDILLCINVQNLSKNAECRHKNKHLIGKIE